jgi:hypothetical protein
MSQSISELLGQRDFSEPPEIQIIRKFVQDKFNASAGVSVGKDQITISVNSSALAGALRLELINLKNLCETDKKLVIRIQH